MKQAFWDALQEKLREEPPDFSHAVVLLEEVKQVCGIFVSIQSHFPVNLHVYCESQSIVILHKLYAHWIPFTGRKKGAKETFRWLPVITVLVAGGTNCAYYNIIIITNRNYLDCCCLNTTR